MIRVRELAFRYGRHESFTLEIDAIEVAAGERVALTGPSGCGKSTLLQLIAGVLTPRSGEIQLAGQTLTALPGGRRRQLRLARVGLIFQEFELLAHLPVLENILLPYDLGLPRDPQARERARALAARAGIERYLAKRPSALSTGERQRVAVCRALVTSPEVLLADEPTASLDPAATDMVLSMLDAHARERPAALLVATHEHHLLPRFDRQIKMTASGSREHSPPPASDSPTACSNPTSS